MTTPDRSRQPVSIIGASAAGLFTAYLLARRGVAVRVHEQAERLSPMRRTLIVTNRLRDLLGEVGDGCVVNEVRRFELFTDGRSAIIPLAKPDLIIERSRLISDLAKHAQAQGAEIHLGRRFVGLAPNGRGLAVMLGRAGQTESVHAETVIGADGAISRVAQAAGWSRRPTVPLVQAIVKLPSDVPPDSVRVWFVPGDTPYFYWLIPDSPTHGALGLIGEDGRETRRSLEAFLAKRGFAAESFQGARIPLYTRWEPVMRHVGSGRVFLVGDAAGQVKVTTVGGIVTGFRGAAGVAEAITNGGASRELAALRRELNLHLHIRRSMHRFTQTDYSRLIDLLNAPSRASLSMHDRDAALGIVWRLLVQQPRFVLMAIRGFLTGGAYLRQSSR